ncbi:MAG: cold shock domain-containing protein [Prolixibacteraceae bacterium]|jgi:cold shock CspA family protein
MGKSQETFNKKEVRNKKEKKRKEKEKKRFARKEGEKVSGWDNMLAYVDENGRISSTPPDPSKRTEIKLDDIQIAVPKHDDSMKEDPVRRGTVTFFNESKGFGFIRDNDSKESIFVHINNLQDAIKEGNLVSFEIGMGSKGPIAMKVKQMK